MADLWHFVAALAFFLLTHAVPSSRAMRARLIGVFGYGKYLVFYSVLSVLALIWLIAAYDGTPHIPLWTPPVWWPTVMAWVMPFVFVLLTTGLPHAYPIEIGVFAITRQPAMVALGVWSLLHIVANGDVAAILLFGAMGALAVVGTVHMENRARSALGKGWPDYASRTSLIPFVALVRGRTKLRYDDVHPLAVLAGSILYVFMLLLHGPVFGIPVLDMI